MAIKRPITVAYGDGIGPEIMDATLRMLLASGAQLDIEEIAIGEKVYKSGISTGIPDSAWESLLRTQVFLKAPITTPQGGGYKSLNVTTRKMLGLYANVRPIRTLQPYVPSKHHMDVVIVRENEEDLYAGIEHQQTSEVVQCLKIISRPGCEKIVRYAFEYARTFNRKKVTCFTKDNIMKMSDGLFHRIFNEIGEEYPDLEKEHRIIDIGSALLADQPDRFDVIVTLNLYGDIISDIAAQVAGSVGLCGSSNIGEHCAMFEAIHGSAPDIAGKNIANPAGLLSGALMMMVHIDQPEAAALLHNAALRTLEDGYHTQDIYSEQHTKKLVGTRAWADAVIERLGEMPQHFPIVSYKNASESQITNLKPPKRVRYPKELLGVDVFLDWQGGSPKELAEKVQSCDTGDLKLTLISNRGAGVWPEGIGETFCTDHWRLRYESTKGKDAVVSHTALVELMGKLDAAGWDFIKTENLYTINGVKGFSLGQGE